MKALNPVKRWNDASLLRAVAVVFWLVLFLVDAHARTATPLWGHQPLPAVVYVQPEATTFSDQVTQYTLAGLMARHARTSREAEPLLWIRNDETGDTWLRLFAARTKVTTETVDPDCWTLVGCMADAEVVRGYVVYREATADAPDPSVIIATSLCAPLGAMAVGRRMGPATRPF